MRMSLVTNKLFDNIKNVDIRGTFCSLIIIMIILNIICNKFQLKLEVILIFCLKCIILSIVSFPVFHVGSALVFLVEAARERDHEGATWSNLLNCCSMYPYLT